MSLLIEKNMRTSGPKLVPGDVLNVDIKSEVGKVSIKWTDPDDTTYENYTFIKWKGTILVRKKDSAPSNMNDGVVLINSTIKNQYKDTAYEDNNLEDGNYYYRFFVYSEDKAYNDGSNMIYNTNVINVDPVLKNNSWETIIDIANKGLGQNYWNIGDEIDVKLVTGKTFTFQIWDFNHFDKSDGSGKANICFGMKHLNDTKYIMRVFDGMSTGSRTWETTKMRNTTLPNTYFKNFPEPLKSSIKETNVRTDTNLDTTEKLFIPSARECGITAYNDELNKTFPIFTDANSKKKKINNGSGSFGPWWTRTRTYNPGSSFSSFLIVTIDGYTDPMDGYDGDNNYICAIFNL